MRSETRSPYLVKIMWFEVNEFRHVIQYSENLLDLCRNYPFKPCNETIHISITLLSHLKRRQGRQTMGLVSINNLISKSITRIHGNWIHYEIKIHTIVWNSIIGFIKGRKTLWILNVIINIYRSMFPLGEHARHEIQGSRVLTQFRTMDFFRT